MTTGTPTTFIDIFKKCLIANHYNLTESSTATSLSNLIAADYIFDLTSTGILYKNNSVLNNNDLKQRNIFYAKATSGITAKTSNFVKAYHFKANVVYQLYKTGDNKFGLVNDYTEITLAANESIKIHGQNTDAYAIITADGNGNLDIEANKVSTLVIPTTDSSSSVPTGALYIKK